MSNQESHKKAKKIGQQKMTTPKHSLSREATQMPKYTILSYWFWGQGGKGRNFPSILSEIEASLEFFRISIV